MNLVGSIIVLLLVAFCLNAAADQIGPIKVTPADSIRINIDADTIIRNQLPETLFGFNINYRSLQNQLWDTKNAQVYPDIVEKLQAFNSAILRYPGGLVGNSFDWEESIGAFDSRQPQKTFFNQNPKRVKFGIDEYLHLLDQIDGNLLYVLNLVGIDSLQPFSEADNEMVAEKNQKLANYLLKKAPNKHRYYQLGNELDRSKYEWDAKKYVLKSRKSINAIRSVDTNAKFIVFLRDFNWKYKQDKSRGTSLSYSYMKEVFAGLPELNDYSLHHYYKGKREDGKSRKITFWMKLLEKSIKDYRSIKGNDPNIWITEHARQMSSSRPGKDNTATYTSNLGGALSTADYLIAISQIPQIKGAVWHGLNVGPWQLFDANIYFKDYRPRPVYWGLRILKETKFPMVMKTETESTNISNNPDGYDVRAVAFRDKNTNQFCLWIVNFSAIRRDVTIKYTPLSGKHSSIKHTFITGPENRDPDDLDLVPNQKPATKLLNINWSNSGATVVSIPPSSVSTMLVLEDND